MNEMNCTNCQEKGHGFKKCKKPIISFGILAYKVINNDIKFLLVQRKDTIGYIDFIRGKYTEDNKYDAIKIFLEEMTSDEKQKLLTKTFEDLWCDLWVNHNSRTFREDKIKAQEKFNKLDIENLLTNTVSKWEVQEYGIPKGRKTRTKEGDLECACREFFEETGIRFLDYLVLNVKPVEETFTGSNGVLYKHIYYIAKYTSNRQPIVDKNNKIQMSEIKSLGWFGITEALNILRDYDSTKKDVLINAYTIIKNLI